MILDKLHDTLMLAGTATVVAKLASLSLNPTSRLSITSSRASLSGLGGIGKTQLALRYAALHAADYDDNVIWIDSVGFEDRQDLLGHKNGRITTHYSQVELINLIEAANKICD